MKTTIADWLWGCKAKFRYLFIASVMMLFTLLDGREIWTQEHRWADIVSGMFYRHDFLHPFLGEATYYDKPLLSYWLIALSTKLTGALTVWTLRLPSALSGLLAIWSIYRLGTTLKNKSFGLLSGWLLLTTFYFVFWARISSADMLNLAGSLFAVSWYMDKRNQATFFDYTVFFFILALTSLCKGLVGAVLPLLAVFIDIHLQKSWKQHFRWPLLVSAIPALILYVLPFLASSYAGLEAYSENGLYMVYRENVLRYFHPFDHQGAIYTYFIYLPIYLLPWAIFFIPALFSLKSRWKKLPIYSKWIAETLFLLFLFFTLSGSRRSYYVLPIVPYAILLIADFLSFHQGEDEKRYWWTARAMICAFIFVFITVIILPAIYYSQFGIHRFAYLLKEEGSKIKPWSQWNVVMLDAESKLSFYLQLPPHTRNYSINGERNRQTDAMLAKAWPILEKKSNDTIFITRQLYLEPLKGYFNGYRLIESPSQHFFPSRHDNAPIAFIPNAS